MILPKGFGCSVLRRKEKVISSPQYVWEVLCKKKSRDRCAPMGMNMVAILNCSLLLLLNSAGCQIRDMEKATTVKNASLTEQQILQLASLTVFFGHQSVGANILQGIQDLMAGNPRLKLNIERSDHPDLVSGPALVECSVGENGKPQSKNDAFAAILNKGLGVRGGIVMYKYCYVDIDSSTDIAQMFQSYQQGINALKGKYPLLKFVYITVPLTTMEPAAKAWAKFLIGRPTERDINAKRNQFNNLLKKTYKNTDPIYDLAEVESTYPDGSRSYFMRGNEKIFTLAPEFTSDGGHLNQKGRRAAAERLLLLLSDL
jgi:hypothetical protein